ncbi:transporter substrate-binding domain-containing protein, partial [Nostoc sp. NIES-2111]
MLAPAGWRNEVPDERNRFMMRRVRASIHQPAPTRDAQRRVLRALIGAVVLAAFFAWAGNGLAPPALASDAASPAIPNFWDPSLRPEKPDMAGLRVIRFMTEDEYPPLNFQTEDGRLAGFNVDLARAVCDVLNVACTIQARRWDTLFEALKEGRGDAVIANVRPTPALRK